MLRFNEPKFVYIYLLYKVFLNHCQNINKSVFIDQNIVNKYTNLMCHMVSHTVWNGF